MTTLTTYRMNLTDYLAAHVADGTYDIKFMIKTYDLEAARAAIRAENAPVTHTVSPEMAAHFAKIEAYHLASYAGKRIWAGAQHDVRRLLSLIHI